MKRALISVSDKTGLIPFARALCESNVEIVATDGTANVLKSADIPSVSISKITGYPEILGGRVKTLHPKIHGGILARPELSSDANDLAHHEIGFFDLVVVNLYPFASVVHDENKSMSDVIENIDIGGHTIIRAAAKNHQHVLVAIDPDDYSLVLEEIKKTEINKKISFNLARKAFLHCAQYDQVIAQWFNGQGDDKDNTYQPDFPPNLSIFATKKQVLRYGENPHQQAALYALQSNLTKTETIQLQGKELSYNNILDANAAINLIDRIQEENCCAIIKHANPCAVAISNTLLDSYQLAYNSDRHSAFGGIIICNGPIDFNTAQHMIDNQFFELIIAPDYSTQALEVLKQKPNIRVLTLPPKKDRLENWEFRQVIGGLLYQQKERPPPIEWSVVSQAKPSAALMQEAKFAWSVVQSVKSNAIVYTNKGQTLGIGAGQPSRITANQIAVMKANEANFSLQGSVLASDAFFPFKDNIEQTAKTGAKTIIQPGGSLNDAEVIASADEHNLCMIFTHYRCFSH